MGLYEKKEKRLPIGGRVRESVKLSVADIAAEYGDHVKPANIIETFIEEGVKRHFAKSKAVKAPATSTPDNTKAALLYLNEVTGRKFSVRADVTARLKEFTIEEVKLVIDYKSREWMGTDSQKYLRPETLFRKSKFEGYLNDANQNVIHTADYQPNQKRTRGDELEQQARQALENNGSPVREDGGFVLKQMDIEHKFE